MRSLTGRGVMAIVLAAVVALCASSAGLAAQGERATFKLAERDNSGISGSITLTDNGDGSTKVVIRLRGVEANASHPAHLHEGTCSGTIPSIRYPVENIVRGRSVTTVPAPLERLKRETLYVNIHPSASELVPVIVCGGLSAPTALPRTGAGGLAGGACSAGWLGLLAAGAALAMGARRVAGARRP